MKRRNAIPISLQSNRVCLVSHGAFVPGQARVLLTGYGCPVCHSVHRRKERVTIVPLTPAPGAAWAFLCLHRPLSFPHSTPPPSLPWPFRQPTLALVMQVEAVGSGAQLEVGRIETSQLHLPPLFWNLVYFYGNQAGQSIMPCV